MKDFKKQYRDLETQVLHLIREKVSKSTYKSRFIDSSAVKVEHDDFVELAIANEQLVFISPSGLQFHWSQVSLEDLIDILNQSQVRHVILNDGIKALDGLELVGKKGFKVQLDEKDIKRFEKWQVLDDPKQYKDFILNGSYRFIAVNWDKKAVFVRPNDLVI